MGVDQFEFPVGYHDLHKVKIIDFQLNRWYSLGYARLEDMKSAGRQIRKFGDWKGVMTGLAEKAASKGQWMNAAFDYRAAEFFTLPSDPDKEALYARFIDIFHHKTCAGEPVERFLIPFENSHIPALHVPSAQPACRGTIVIHRGFDSFIEEFYSLAVYFSYHGYNVILFESPGQGAALKKFGLPLTDQW